MREMIFGEAPAWEQIMQGLRELEGQINRSQQTSPSQKL